MLCISMVMLTCLIDRQVTISWFWGFACDVLLGCYIRIIYQLAFFNNAIGALNIKTVADNHFITKP